MNIGIVGNRKFNNKNYIETVLISILEKNNIDIKDITIISGGAPGVDTIAVNIAKEYGLPFKEFLPNYNRYGRNASIIRNKEIVQHSDIVLAFPTKESKGTYNTISVCKKLNVPCHVFMVNNFLPTINEGFEIHGDKMIYNNKDNPLKFGKNKSFTPYKTTLSNGIVYSLYSFSKKNNNMVTPSEFKNILKGYHEYVVTDYDSYINFINRSTIYITNLISKISIDLIMTPSTRSRLLGDILKELKSKLPSSYGFSFFPYTIIKTPENLEFKKEYLNKLSDKTITSLLNKTKNPNFKIQNIPVEFRNTIVNFMDIDGVDIKNLYNKNIVIIDDFLTSGATMRECFRVLVEKYGAKSVTGITLYKK